MRRHEGAQALTDIHSGRIKGIKMLKLLETVEPHCLASNINQQLSQMYKDG